MNVDERVFMRLASLVTQGEAVLRTRRAPSAGHLTGDFVDVQLATQWMTSCANFLERVFGAESAHHKRLVRHFEKYPKWSDAQQAFGVMLAAKDDLDNDALFSIKRLIQGDLFDEFLEQAEYLLESNYPGPAAMIAGCVLEDSLRKMCEELSVPLPEKPKLDAMNSELAKREAYPKLVQKKITALADIRNNAAHGKWDEFESSDVSSMIRDVRDFLVRYRS